MKKLILLLTTALCLLLSGCGNAFAKEQYGDDQKIAASDHYDAKKLKTTETTASCSLNASKLDGWTTVWKCSSDEDKAVAAWVSIGLSKGTAKVVHVDGSGNVSTLLEYKSEGDSGVTGKGSADRVIKLSKGENKIKVVGYDCETAEVEIKINL
ncbi:MAG: hypothetical protein K2J80_06860 [Oscillospiraceae bacterium]|nr:hypothetical protein [Oscillospiraceae bacterium]